MPATETATPLLQVVVSQAVNFSQVRYRQLGHYSGDQTGFIAKANLASSTAQWINKYWIHQYFCRQIQLEKYHF